MVVIQTLRKIGIDLRRQICRAIEARHYATSPPSVFAPPQVEP